MKGKGFSKEPEKEKITEEGRKMAGEGRERKRIIGITGGVGSGKSFLLSLLKEDYGAKIILADEIARQLMEPGKPCLQQVIMALGNSFLKEDGSVDRQALAEVIFHDEQAKRIVDQMIHPAAWKEIRQETEEAEEPLVVIEAAIADEKMHDICQEIWYVYTSRENRIARLMENRGYTREKCEAIMKSQLGEEEFRSFCSCELDNNKGKEEIKSQLRAIMDREKGYE